MNEPASFDTNKERAWNWPVEDKPYWNLHCPQNEWDDPPYRTSMQITPMHCYLYVVYVNYIIVIALYEIHGFSG